MERAYNLTVEQVAGIAGCHRNTVLRYEKNGFLKPMQSCLTGPDLNMSLGFSCKDFTDAKEAIFAIENMKCSGLVGLLCFMVLSNSSINLSVLFSF